MKKRKMETWKTWLCTACSVILCAATGGGVVVQAETVADTEAYVSEQAGEVETATADTEDAGDLSETDSSLDAEEIPETSDPGLAVYYGDADEAETDNRYEAIVLPSVTDKTTSTLNVQVTGTFHQTEARSMLSMVNEFRTGDPWIYDQNNNKVTISGLRELTYDYDLEKAAMQRAVELAVSYSHTRPNGTECFTAYSSLRYKAENIAYGFDNAESVFEAWKEDNAEYSGQGHRRDMLTLYGTTQTGAQSIGIACFEYQGVKFWVQEFRTNVVSALSTTAADSTYTGSVSVLKSELENVKVSSDPTALSMSVGETVSVPSVSAAYHYKNTGVFRSMSTPLNAAWTSADSSIARVIGSRVRGVSSGTTNLNTTATFDTSYPLSAEVTVHALPSGISLDRNTLELAKNEIADLIASVWPSDAIQDVTWESDNTAVITVDQNGRVKAVGTGTATVTVTTRNGKFRASCTITVPESAETKNGWYREENDKLYWYEDNVRQGTSSDPKGVWYGGTNRGREIYDLASDGWYWLDADANGAKATGKEVFVPYIYREEDDWTALKKRAQSYDSDAGMEDYVYQCMVNKTGKWVRYDENGKMLKGWITITGTLAELYPDQAGNTYYYDYKTGLMAKGKITMNGKTYYFDSKTGVLLGQTD